MYSGENDARIALSESAVVVVDPVGKRGQGQSFDFVQLLVVFIVETPRRAVFVSREDLLVGSILRHVGIIPDKSVWDYLCPGSIPGFRFLRVVALVKNRMPAVLGVMEVFG